MNRALYFVLGLAAVLAMGALGYDGELPVWSRTASVPLGFANYDTMVVAAGANPPVYTSGDTLKMRENGRYIPISRVEVRYFGTTRDTCVLEFGWSHQAQRSRYMVIVDSTMRYDQIPIRAEWVRVKPYNYVESGEIRLLAVGTR